jgi:hypothetical protein
MTKANVAVQALDAVKKFRVIAVTMNLVQYVKLRLLLSCPYPAGKTISFAAAKPWQNRHRTFTALAESNSALEAIATQATPPSSVHSDSRPVKEKNHGRVAKALHVSKNIQSPPPSDGIRLQRLSDKLRLRLRAANTRPTERNSKKKRGEHAEMSSAIEAAADAISRDHANQEDIIKSLHDAIVSDKRPKREKKKANEKKKKPAYVDTSALFESFPTEKAPKRKRIKPKEERLEADEWQDRGWGIDGVHLAASTYIHHAIMIL